MGGPRPKVGGIRLDERLVRDGLAQDLVEARGLVMAGRVVVDDQRVDKPGAPVRDEQKVRLKGARGRFVSRGGEKLQGAIVDLGLSGAFSGKVVLDVGASTGGFTHCALEEGAARVIALDVGTAQLAYELRTDPRVVSVERTHIKDFDPTPYGMIDWLLADVSFTSLARLAPSLVRIAPNARMLLLVKPQFELPQSDVPDGGVVTDDASRARAVALVKEAFEALGKRQFREAPSRVAGRSGNQEIFLLVEK